MKVKESPSHEDSLRRLRWRCRRGLLELDIWLERFAASQLRRLSQNECAELEILLEEADADLLAWLEDRQPVPQHHIQILERIRLLV